MAHGSFRTLRSSRWRIWRGQIRSSRALKSSTERGHQLGAEAASIQQGRLLSEGRRRRTWLEGGLAERLLGEGADLAGGVEGGRQAIHEPPLVAVRRTRRRHCKRSTADDASPGPRVGLELGAVAFWLNGIDFGLSGIARRRRAGGGNGGGFGGFSLGFLYGSGG